MLSHSRAAFGHRPSGGLRDAGSAKPASRLIAAISGTSSSWATRSTIFGFIVRVDRCWYLRTIASPISR